METCCSVLIVEDDEDIQTSLLEMLESEGYQARAASNGQEALNLLLDATPHPCLILLDMMMPVMNGREFLDKVMADDKLSKLPVLIVSAVADKANTSGSVGFLKKPLDIDALLNVVSQYCKN